MGFGPALFPWVMLFPLLLSLISPPEPGGCEDLQVPNPAQCMSWPSLLMDLALALGSLTPQKTLEQEGLHNLPNSRLFPQYFT